jgi:hypothetical protein
VKSGASSVSKIEPSADTTLRAPPPSTIATDHGLVSMDGLSDVKLESLFKFV